MRDLGSAARQRAGVGAIVALVAVLCGCGASDGDAAPSDASARPTSSAGDVAGTPLPEAVQELDIDGVDYSFTISPDPASGLKPGWTLVRFHNVGAEAHQVMFARIKDGVDMSELAAAGADDSSGAGAIEFVDMIGGVSYIGPGQDTTALVNLSEGLTMAMCYVPDAEGVAHALMGMTTPLTVSAPSEGAAPEPEPGGEAVVGTIELAADGYQLPDHMGPGWYHVTNTDTALHELALLRLGTTVDDDEVAPLVDDLATNQTPDVELDAVGGMGAVSPGFDGYLYLDLAAGDYLAVDFMPDPGDPRPHMLDGYYATFSV